MRDRESIERNLSDVLKKSYSDSERTQLLAKLFLGVLLDIREILAYLAFKRGGSYGMGR